MREPSAVFPVEQPEPELPTVFEVWRGRDFSWSVWELRTLRTKAELKNHFRELGFHRTARGYGRMVEGPCTGCEDITKASLVDTHGRCPKCRPTVGCPRLAAEREASLRRQEARIRRGDPLRRVYFKRRYPATVMGASVGARRRRAS